MAHPVIQAVGFTGSRRGGLALHALAQSRAQPIPVFAEMSSINPVFLLPAALRLRAAVMAQEFVDSMTLGVGQFCTSPGVVVAIDGSALEAFMVAAAAAVAAKPAGTMLSPAICEAHRAGGSRLDDRPGVQCLAQGKASDGPCRAQARLYGAAAKDFISDANLSEEVFGAICHCAGGTQGAPIGHTCHHCLK